MTADPTPSSAPPRPPLSKVMLAMDVVDTLRHHRAIVASELNEEARERALIERVKGIYEDQGIEVPDDVIRKGVEALKADRFTYEAPERTFAVRLAEIYVRRGTWAKRALAVLAVVGSVWGGLAYADHKRDQAHIQAFTARVSQEDGVRAALDRRIARVQGLLDEPGSEVDAPVVRELRVKTRVGLERTRSRLQAWDQARVSLAADEYPDERQAFDDTLSLRRENLNALAKRVGQLEGNLQTIHQLQSVGSEIGRTLALATSMAIPPAVQQHVDSLLAQAKAALDAGDAQAAQAHVAEISSLLANVRKLAQTKRSIESGLAAETQRLASMSLDASTRQEVDALQSSIRSNLAAKKYNDATSMLQELRWIASLLDQAYEMKIVSAPGKRSGVRRRLRNRSDGHNYYILVDILGANGKPMPVEFRNDEDQVLRRASRVGVRVPQSVYEQVKADKLDNGIVDKQFFGRKERGKRKPTYAFEVAGGWIWNW